MNSVFKKICLEIAEDLAEEMKDEFDKPSKVWTREWMKRKNKSISESLNKEILIEDPKGFAKFFRMDATSFNQILELIGPCK